MNIYERVDWVANKAPSQRNYVEAEMLVNIIEKLRYFAYKIDSDRSYYEDLAQKMVCRVEDLISEHNIEITLARIYENYNGFSLMIMGREELFSSEDSITEYCNEFNIQVLNKYDFDTAFRERLYVTRLSYDAQTNSLAKL